MSQAENLNQFFTDHAINQAQLARALGVSRAAVNTFVKTGQLPAKFGELERDTLAKVLIAHGVTYKQAASLSGANLKNLIHKQKPPASAGLTGGFLSPRSDQGKEVTSMLPRKVRLAQATRQFFKLAADPFGELQSAADVFLCPQNRYVFELLKDCAKHGGAVALVGESGSGKTTLKQLLTEQLNAPDSKVTVVEPYVQAMEEDDSRGKTLKSAAIAAAIVKAINPLAKPLRDSQARLDQVHQLLKNNHAGGNHTVLIIEEAHALPIPTLRHLKRFLEMRSGFKSLISVILIGQPELGLRLAPKNIETREITQRFEVCTMAPLSNDVEAFLAHKLKKTAVPLNALFDKGALDAIDSRLSNQRGGRDLNNLYPLALCNLAAACLNEAEQLGVSKVNAEIVQGAAV